jgi:hypothetical protein
MSDFIYSSKHKPQGELGKHIQSIYHNDSPQVVEYHGEWGSLGVSRSLYNGFQPLETDDYIFVVIGGPILCFQDNLFLTGNDPVAGTKAIFARWRAGLVQWDEDLSGPYAVLIVDKAALKLRCITDLMMFIPVYKCLHDGVLTLGTHVDALARASGQKKDLDLVSVTDFILNDVVTYPYTMYQNIRQLHPAAEHSFTVKKNSSNLQEYEPNIYWLPREENLYSNINEAAQVLREGSLDYVHRVTEGMDHVAQFISAGEDSRAVAGMLPQRLKRDAFVFLDSMNREGKIAQRVAKAYKADFHPDFRSETHYLDILPEAADLIGSGHQHIHAHSLIFHKTCALGYYSAVFGGYLADSLLKANYSQSFRGKGRFPFLPHFFIPGETRTKPIKNLLIKQNVLQVIDERRKMQLQRVQSFRKDSSHEWFVLWPITMRTAVPYFYSNRRLFRIYEPFLSKKASKMAALVPTQWKLNHRLFNKAFRPYLKSSRWIFHADGRLPYFPWWANIPVQASIWFGRQLGARAGIIKGNQGPWGDWGQIMGSRKWQSTIQSYANGFEKIKSLLKVKSVDELFDSQTLSRTQKVNLLQILRFLS